MVERPPAAVTAMECAGRESTVIPAEFASRLAGRFKRPLGDRFGLTNFGVNLTTLAPGSQSALRHRHSEADEFVYIVSGELVLRHDDGECVMREGMCAGFPKGGTAHHLVNRSSASATYLEFGDRRPGDRAVYPDDDLLAEIVGKEWRFAHKDGTPYSG